MIADDSSNPALNCKEDMERSGMWRWKINQQGNNLFEHVWVVNVFQFRLINYHLPFILKAKPLLNILFSNQVVMTVQGSRELCNRLTAIWANNCESLQVPSGAVGCPVPAERWCLPATSPGSVFLSRPAAAAGAAVSSPVWQFRLQAGWVNYVAWITSGNGIRDDKKIEYFFNFIHL